ncbi:hypothetical protein ACFFKU_01250 [Kineococcus gynurae]|uniref:LemA protein n=1 Tax=Kineococcus gynurae TaxID=452979 RepID=A0ABV5LQ11_9ACTN
MEPFGTVVLVLVVLAVLGVIAWAAATRSALVRMRDLAVEAGALAEQRRSRLSDLDGRPNRDEPEIRRAITDAEQRLAGDLSFHAAAVRAYDARLSAAPASWVGAVSGLHPLGASADHA